MDRFGDTRTAPLMAGDSLADVGSDCLPNGKTISKAGPAMRECSHWHQVKSIRLASPQVVSIH
jgi:hypothetical protein